MDSRDEWYIIVSAARHGGNPILRLTIVSNKDRNKVRSLALCAEETMKRPARCILVREASLLFEAIKVN